MTDAPFPETHRARLRLLVDDSTPDAPSFEELCVAIRAALAEIDRLRQALTEICLRLETKIPDDVETHRELSAERNRRLVAVYAIAESGLR
jgi:hypothetical protein